MSFCVNTVYRDLLATNKIWRIGEFQKIARKITVKIFHVVTTPTIFICTRETLCLEG